MTSTQAWAVKYRPRETAELVGQRHAKELLNAAFRQRNATPPTILLTGPWGTGKTTLARIIAKRWVCGEQVEASEHTIACNKCSRCDEVDDGRYPDVMEVDAATHTGVEEMRQLLMRAEHLPSSGRARVVIIDEAHMLSKAASNAMLKRLEEPQEHLRFILATTEAHEILATIRSRCTTIQLKPLSEAELATHLERIAEKEGTPIPPATALEIARLTDGGGRDAVTLLQTICGGDDRSRERVRTIQNIPRSNELNELWTQIINGDGKAAESKLNELFDKGFGPERIWLAMVGEMPQEQLDRIPEAGQLIVERLDSMTATITAKTTARLLCYELAKLASRAELPGEGRDVATGVADTAEMDSTDG